RVFPLWAPFLVLALGAGYLAARWGSIPETFASHWGPGGVANGFSHRSAGGVFGPLFFALPLFVVFEAFGLALATQRDRKPERAPMIDATRSLLRLIETALSAGIALIACVLPFGVAQGSLLGVVPVVAIGLALLFGMPRVMQATREVASRQNLKGYNGLTY